MFFTLILSSFLTFVELNCENLFDTRHDSLKNDYEFLHRAVISGRLIVIGASWQIFLR